MGIEEALEAPRSHHQWLPDRLTIEGRANESVARALEAMGHTVSHGGSQGSANSIQRDPATGMLVGAPDPRSSDAGAAGP
jgi:gamma-glutamyltranspeptidase/glutathione hydrolase